MSALTPKIAIENRAHSTMCFACGQEDGTVRCIVVGWSDFLHEKYKRHGGSTSVALCTHCRQMLADVLVKEVV